MAKTLSLDTPPDFSFAATVYSHGWCELPPFSLNLEGWRLQYVFSDMSGQKHSVGVLHETDGGIRIDLSNSKVPDEKVLADVRQILRLDEDLSQFYSKLAGYPELDWITQRRAGRLLRSATVWEDLVKSLCTTNCSWALTKIMVRNLVEKLGQPAGRSVWAFPDATAMASETEQFYRDEIRSGYRAPYFLQLAESVAAGLIDPESWLDPSIQTPDLKREIKRIKGIGDYAAENLLKLLGRYDGLALDSWLRSQFYKKHNSAKVCKDNKIERHYQRFGDWRGLAIWCDMTEKWIA